MTAAAERFQSHQRAIGADWFCLLRDLVNVNSGFTNIAGQRRVFDILAARFARLGFEAGKICLRENRQAMVFQLPEAAPDVLLVGHTDTMFQPDSDFQSLEADGAVLTGPGISDMKAGLVLILMLLETLDNPALLRRVRVFINDDEELGARYSRDALKRQAQGVRFALVFEPGLTDGSYVLGYSAARRVAGRRSYALRTAMRYYGRDEVPDLAEHLRTIRNGLAAGQAEVPLPDAWRRMADDRFNPSGRAIVVGLGPYGGKTHTTDEFLRPETIGERLEAAELITRRLLEPSTGGSARQTCA